MKAQYLITKTVTILMVLAISLPSLAMNKLLVTKKKGNIFLKKNGEFKEANEGISITNLTEIFTEENSLGTFVDSYDHVIHMSESSLMKVVNRMYELKRGYVWFQSQSEKEFFITTSNSKIHFKGGEFIVIYDEVSGKTQLLCFSGEVSFAHSLKPDQKTILYPGQFSYLLKDDLGLPRTPTDIGYNSFQGILTKFPGIKPMFQSHLFEQYNDHTLKAHLKRKEDDHKNFVLEEKEGSKKGRLIYYRYNDLKEAKDFHKWGLQNVQNDYLERLKKENKSLKEKEYMKKNRFNIKVYGTETIRKPIKKNKFSSKEKRARAVSGMKTNKPSHKKLKNYKDFDKSLDTQLNKNRRHDPPINKLINELESYKMDYSESY